MLDGTSYIVDRRNGTVSQPDHVDTLLGLGMPMRGDDQMIDAKLAWTTAEDDLSLPRGNIYVTYKVALPTDLSPADLEGIEYMNIARLCFIFIFCCSLVICVEESEASSHRNCQG